MTDKTKLKRCKGKFDLCSNWYGEFSNGRDYGAPRAKGFCFAEMTNIDNGKRSRTLPFFAYGTKKGEVLLLNFCPFCGYDYRKTRH